MAEEFHLEILVITILMVLSFVSGHLLRKFNILWLPESIVAGTKEGREASLRLEKTVTCFCWMKERGD